MITPHLLYDSREKLPLQVIKDFPGKLERTTLAVGDYACSCGCTGFERKESDFDNYQKVTQQWEEMKAAYKYPFMVVNRDSVKFLRENLSSYGVRVGFLSSLLVRGCIPLFVDNHYDMISVMYRTIIKQHDGKLRGLHEFNPVRHVTKKDEQLNLLTALPGVGPKLATEILKQFGTPYKFITAEPKEMLEINGMGKVTVAKIKRVLQEEQ